MQNKFTAEQMEQLKVMETEITLCAHVPDPSLLPPLPEVSVTMTPCSSEPFSPSLSVQLTMKKRYDVSQQSLDLQKLRFDPGMADHGNFGACQGIGGLPGRKTSYRQQLGGGVIAGTGPARSLSAF